MAEAGVRNDSFRPGAAVTVGSVVLVPIERTVLRGDRRSGHMWLSAVKEPYALIVRDAHGTRAFDRDAVALPLEALRDKVPGLDALLGSQAG